MMVFGDKCWSVYNFELCEIFIIIDKQKFQDIH